MAILLREWLLTHWEWRDGGNSVYPRGHGLDWWSTVFSGGVDPFLFRGSEGRLVFVGQGPAYVVSLGIPSWVIIGSNRRCNSVMETQLSVHHHS